MYFGHLLQPHDHEYDGEADIRLTGSSSDLSTLQVGVPVQDELLELCLEVRNAVKFQLGLIIASLGLQKQNVHFVWPISSPRRASRSLIMGLKWRRIRVTEK